MKSACFDSLVLIFAYLPSGVLVDGPNHQVALPEEWATFNCTVECTHDVKWSVEIYPTDISQMCNNDQNLDVCTHTLRDCSTTMSTTNHLEQLRIKAPSENVGERIAVQCIAVSRTFDPFADDCQPFVEYARVAYLSGK